VRPAGSGFSRWARQAAQQPAPTGAKARVSGIALEISRQIFFIFHSRNRFFRRANFVPVASALLRRTKTFCAKNFTIARSIFYRDALAQAIAISAIGANDYLCAPTDEHSVSAHAELQILRGSHCDLRATQAK